MLLVVMFMQLIPPFFTPVQFSVPSCLPLLGRVESKIGFTKSDSKTFEQALSFLFASTDLKAINVLVALSHIPICRQFFSVY